MMNNKRLRHIKLDKRKSFLLKLYEILNDITYKDIIYWNTKGNGIIISNINSLCNIVLPKFYKHHNYSSFVRQLNLYGFHKSIGIIKEGEGFEHEKFNKNITKEQIEKIIKQKKRIKFLTYYLGNNNNKKNNIEEPVNIDDISINSESDILKYLLDKNKELEQNIKELKKELIEEKNFNMILNEEIQQYIEKFKGHNIIIEKIIKNKCENKINNISNKIKSKNLKQLFRKYLYFLKIYSPYVDIQKDNIIKYETIKVENLKISNKTFTDDKEIFNNNLNSNTESFFDENTFPYHRHNIDSTDLNLMNNNSSNSLFYKDMK